jgi:hypothetical protein
MSKILMLKTLKSGGAICAEVNAILEMMRKAAAEKGLDINTATVEQKREVLKSMGYEEYFEILKKEVEFEWL